MKTCNCTNKNWHLVCDNCGGSLPSCLDCTGTERQLKEARAEIERKDKLIEQMREALKFSLIADEVRQTRNVCASDINDACETSRIKRIAALSAAERGG